MYFKCLDSPPVRSKYSERLGVRQRGHKHTHHSKGEISRTHHYKVWERAGEESGHTSLSLKKIICAEPSRHGTHVGI